MKNIFKYATMLAAFAMGVAAFSSCGKDDNEIEKNETTNSTSDIYKTKYGYLKCPDSNHPHQIDLELPSGTIWACCNVGCTNPWKDGGYFAYGETKEKSVSKYTKSGYLYANSSSLPDDISGTSYDASTAVMGSSWKMPNSTQYAELLSSCTQTTDIKNGVRYVKFVSKKNGGELVLTGNDVIHNGAHSTIYSSINYGGGDSDSETIYTAYWTSTNMYYCLSSSSYASLQFRKAEGGLYYALWAHYDGPLSEELAANGFHIRAVKK